MENIFNGIIIGADKNTKMASHSAIWNNFNAVMRFQHLCYEVYGLHAFAVFNVIEITQGDTEYGFFFHTVYCFIVLVYKYNLAYSRSSCACL